MQAHKAVWYTGHLPYPGDNTVREVLGEKVRLGLPQPWLSASGSAHVLYTT